MNAREMIKLLREHGFVFVSQAGSHAKFRKGKMQVVVPMHNGDLKLGTAKNILKQAGIENYTIKRS